MSWQKAQIIHANLYPSRRHMVGVTLWVQPPIMIHSVPHLTTKHQQPYHVLRCKTNWLYPEDVVDQFRMEDNHVWINPQSLKMLPEYRDEVEYILLDEVDSEYRKILHKRREIRRQHLQ